MKLAAPHGNIFHYFALLPALLVLSACTETIPIKPFADQISVPNHINCELELGGYFNKKYGLKDIGERALVKLQFTIPQAAFVNKNNDAKVRRYKLAAEADNRVIFYVDGITQAGAKIASIQFRDNTKNDSVEFNIESASGRIGYVVQNEGSLFVRLADSSGVVLSDTSNTSDKDRDWSGFIDAKQSVVYLTDDTYRKRSIQNEAFTIDEIDKSCN